MTPKKPSLSLLELNNRVKAEVKRSFSESYWVVAEISEVNVNFSGHCYLELVEKSPDNQQIIARSRATIWAYTFRLLKAYFESVAGEQLSPGLKIMVQASVEFHEVYGFSLNIKDIDPSYTLGDIARKRQEVIGKLRAEGVFHLNKELAFPLVPQRIAVISSATAAGYGDFIDQLANNRHGFKFSVTLFQAFMQGADAEQSIINALEQIFQAGTAFDVVVIIRGGGSQADLDCFNAYWLCYHITQFPIAVITGIGHERDETIADLVAHSNLKTPTAVAEFLINHAASFNEYLNEAYERVNTITVNRMKSWNDRTAKIAHALITVVNLRINSEKQRLASLNQLTKKSFSVYIQQNNASIKNLRHQLHLHLQHLFTAKEQQYAVINQKFSARTQQYVRQEKMMLEQYQTKLHLLDPKKILKRGYTITFVDGKLIKSAAQVKPGDHIESIWIDGFASSTVNEIKPTDAND